MTKTRDNLHRKPSIFPWFLWDFPLIFPPKTSKNQSIDLSFAHFPRRTAKKNSRPVHLEARCFGSLRWKRVSFSHGFFMVILSPVRGLQESWNQRVNSYIDQLMIPELIFGYIRSYSKTGHIQKEYQHHGFVILTVFLLSPLEQRLNSISSDHCKMVPPVVVAWNVGANVSLQFHGLGLSWYIDLVFMVISIVNF